MSPKPTLVLVPGSWHSPDVWNKIVALVEVQQYKCVPVTLPSTLSNPSASFADDVGAVRDAIVAETTQGRDVVLVVHSFGGAIGASAIKGLARPKGGLSSSSKNDSLGHVIGIVMIATGFVQTGISFIDAAGGKPPPQWKADTESGFAVIVADARDMFYHDLPEKEGNYWVEKLTKQALKPLTERSEAAYTGWKDVPVWFIATTEDRALPVFVQRIFVQDAKDAGADVTLKEVESSHSPMLSKPKETADIILEAVAAFV